MLSKGLGSTCTRPPFGYLCFKGYQLKKEVYLEVPLLSENPLTGNQ